MNNLAKALKFLAKFLIWLIENNPELREKLVEIIKETELGKLNDYR